MAGSLVKIDEEIVTSAVASVTLGGSDWDSSYDVYMVRFNNMKADTDTGNFQYRITKSGVADTTANYDTAYKYLQANTSFSNGALTNQTVLNIDAKGTGTGEASNGIFYLFNFNNSSEYSFGTLEVVSLQFTPANTGQQGGFVHTVASASDGIQFLCDTGNISAGTFTLYGLKK